MQSHPSPVIVHHMAALDGRYPPNSLDAIRACLEDGAAFIELDITALANDDYLLVHDPVLESETNGVGEVGKTSVETARALFYKDTHTPVAVLRDVVRLLLDYRGASRVQLDFKNVLPFTDDEPLRRLIEIIEPLGDRVLVSTGADWQLRRLRKLAGWLDLGFDIHFVIDWRREGETVDPRIPPYRKGAYGYWDDHPLATQRYYSMSGYLLERCEMMVALVPRLSTFYVDHKLLAQSLDDGFNWAQALHTFGIKLDAWTLDTTNPVAVGNAKRLHAAGVDQFTTNTPHELAALLHDT
jgi:glycerophosphoryl diester phosphodiesterase